MTSMLDQMIIDAKDKPSYEGSLHLAILGLGGWKRVEEVLLIDSGAPYLTVRLAGDRGITIVSKDHISAARWVEIGEMQPEDEGLAIIGGPISF